MTAIDEDGRHHLERALVILHDHHPGHGVFKTDSCRAPEQGGPWAPRNCHAAVGIAFAEASASAVHADRKMEERVPKENGLMLEGRVTTLNFSPKGDIEGYMVETDSGTVQVNVPKEGVLAAPHIGERVTLRVEREEHEHTHPVYRLRDAAASMTGVVARLNYARHGEVNGFVLADGPFVHLKPDGARKHGVQVGERVEVEGTRREGSAISVIEARSLKRVERS